jgi:hypothetical protein
MYWGTPKILISGKGWKNKYRAQERLKKLAGGKNMKCTNAFRF